MRMGRNPCCEKQGLKKGPWTPEEDKLLVDYIQAHGHGSWRSLPKLAGLERCGKSCRLRWTNYLRPDIKRGPFTAEEKKSIIQLHGIVGNKWSVIAGQLPGRTDNEIKNYWNTHLRKQLLHMGIDPETHSSTTSTTNTITPSSSSSFSAARHMAQWESARLEAEARLSRQSLLFSSITNSFHSPTTASTTPVTVNQTETKQEPDVILRIWNSEAGEVFRKAAAAAAALKTEDYSSSCNTKQSSALTDEMKEKKEEVESRSKEVEENDEQFYLDLAGGDELSLYQSQFRSCCFSMFSTDLGEASLDHDDPFK